MRTYVRAHSVTHWTASAYAVDTKIFKIYYGYYYGTLDEGRVTSTLKWVEETAVEGRA